MAWESILDIKIDNVRNYDKQWIDNRKNNKYEIKTASSKESKRNNNNNNKNNNNDNDNDKDDIVINYNNN